MSCSTGCDDPPVTERRGGGPGEDPSSPGILANWIARVPWCRWGADARLSSANVRLRAAAQATTRGPFVLDSLHGTRPASRVRPTGRIVTSPLKLAPLLAELWRLPACIIAGGHGGMAPIHGKDGVGGSIPPGGFHQGTDQRQRWSVSVSGAFGRWA